MAEPVHRKEDADFSGKAPHPGSDPPVLRKENGEWLILNTVILALPALFAFCASFWLSRIGWGSKSALWFLYEASRYVAYVGIAVSAGVAVVCAIYHTASHKNIAMAGLSVCASIFLLWGAERVFVSP